MYKTYYGQGSGRTRTFFVDELCFFFNARCFILGLHGKTRAIFFFNPVGLYSNIALCTIANQSLLYFADITYVKYKNKLDILKVILMK